MNMIDMNREIHAAIYLGVELLDHITYKCSALLITAQPVLQNYFTNLHYHQQYMKIPVAGLTYKTLLQWLINLMKCKMSKTSDLLPSITTKKAPTTPSPLQLLTTFQLLRPKLVTLNFSFPHFQFVRTSRWFYPYPESDNLSHPKLLSSSKIQPSLT